MAACAGPERARSRRVAMAAGRLAKANKNFMGIYSRTVKTPECNAALPFGQGSTQSLDHFSFAYAKLLAGSIIAMQDALGANTAQKRLPKRFHFHYYSRVDYVWRMVSSRVAPVPGINTRQK